MRPMQKSQLPLTARWPDHELGQELKVISQVLDHHPIIAALAHQDLCGNFKDVGAPGLSADQVVRCALLKRMHDFSYAKLAFHLEDSSSFRAFVRLAWGEEVKKSALQAAIKKLTPETWATINRLIIEYAQAEKIEAGRKVRGDSTVVASHIHYPHDSGLLWDGVRVVTRLLTKLVAVEPELGGIFTDHVRRAKRRHLKIVNARKEKERRSAYRDLVKVAEKTFGYGQRLLEQSPGHNWSPQAVALVSQLREYLDALGVVIDQTRRRVFHGEQVPVEEKLVSLFEPHTEVIVKDRREVQFGHKIFLTGGQSSLILDCVVTEGNPSDAGMATPLISRLQELYGMTPRQASFDGGFASQDNLRALKAMGVQDVAFSKKRGLKIEEMTRSAWVFKKLRNFRAGIEGCISTLKRAFHLDRCPWKGWESFKSYVLSGVVAYNLVVLARHLLA